MSSLLLHSEICTSNHFSDFDAVQANQHQSTFLTKRFGSQYAAAFQQIDSLSFIMGSPGMMIQRVVWS